MVSGKKRNRRRKSPADKEAKMFATLKRTAKLLRVPTQAERDMAYLNEAGDRYDLEARERNLDSRSRGIVL